MVIRVVAVAIVVPLACLFIFVPLTLVGRFEASPWVLAVSAGLLMVLLFGGCAAYVGIVLYRRKTKLDAIFAPLGLEGGAYQTFFRQYHGTVQERQIDVWIRRGPVLEIEVSSSLQTRLGVTGRHADTRVLAGWLGHQPLSLDAPDLANLTVFALDEGWARSLLSNPHAVELLQRLTALESVFTRQQVILGPGTMRLMCSGNKRLFGFDPEAEAVHQWLEDLLRLVHIAERLPEPQITAEETSAERFADRLRSSNPYLALWIALGAMVFIIACSVIVAIAVVLLTNMQ
jgi:hypothetical protein